jgi:hypothetical protein
MPNIAFQEQLQDLEQVVQEYARVPEGETWVPLSLFIPTGDQVAVAIIPLRGKEVRVTDGGEILNRFRLLGLEVRDDSKVAEDVRVLAHAYGFQLVDGELARNVSVDEVPTAILNLAEAELAVAGRLYSRLYAVHDLQFRVIAKSSLRQELTRKAMRHTHFELDYPEKYHDGEFFCFVDGSKPMGVKLVTNKQTMLDALVVHHLYEREPMSLAALKKPDAILGGRRVVNFESTFQGRIFEGTARLAEEINRIVA